MIKIFLSVLIGMMPMVPIFAQHPDGKPMPSADRAKTTVDRISKTVPFTEQQKKNLIPIFTTFYDDVRAKQAFRDPSKMEPLEKARDAKVEKLLNNKKLYKQYQDAILEMKAQFQEHQHHQGAH
jgi:hypothetical protein